MTSPFLIPTEEVGVYELHASNSSIELFQTCARAGQYNKVFRRELNSERAALFFGGVLHDALVPRKLNLPNWELLQEQVIYNAYKDNPTGLAEWRTPDRAIEAVKLYNKTYPLESEPFKILPGTVELEFHLLLGEAELNCEITDHTGTYFVKKIQVFWTGFIDALIDYGVILVEDHKTSSIISGNFFDDFQLSAQMLGYCWAARKLGYKAEGLFLDVLGMRKPTRTGTANEFARQRFFYSDEHIAEWEKDTFTLITDFLEHLCRNYFPKMTKWCHGKYGKCQYWDVCTQLPENRMGVLMGSSYKDIEKKDKDKITFGVPELPPETNLLEGIL